MGEKYLQNLADLICHFLRKSGEKKVQEKIVFNHATLIKVKFKPVKHFPIPVDDNCKKSL